MSPHYQLKRILVAIRCFPLVSLASLRWAVAAEWQPVSVTIPAPNEAAVWAFWPAPDGGMTVGSDAVYERAPAGGWRKIAGSDASSVRDFTAWRDDLWVADSRGLAVYSRRNGSFHRLPFVDQEVWQLAACGDAIVAVTRDRILMVDPVAERLLQSESAPSPSRLVLLRFPDHVTIKQGQVASWTYRAGRLSQDPVALGYWWVAGDDFVIRDQIRWRGRTLPHDLAEKTITTVVPWGSDLFLGTYSGGLYRVGDDTTSPRRIRLPEQAAQICAARVMGGRLWVATTRALYRLEPVAVAAHLVTDPLPSNVVPGPAGLLIADARTEVIGQDAALPKTWSWTVDSRGRVALGQWGQLIYDGQSIAIGDAPINGLVADGEGVLASCGHQVVRVDFASKHVTEVFKTNALIASLARMGDRIYAIDFEGELAAYAADTGDGRTVIGRYPDQRFIRLDVLRGELILTSATSMTLPLASVTPTGLPAEFTNLRVFPDTRQMLAVLREGSVNRIYSSADGRRWTPWAVPFLQTIGAPTGITADADHLFICGANDVLRLARTGIAPAVAPPMPEVSLLFDGLAPERHSVFRPIERARFATAVSPVDELTEPAGVRYRLRPTQSDWIATASSPAIEFNALRAGRYTFEAQQVRFGLSSPSAVIAFAIPPPWYLRWPSLLAYLVSLPALGYGGYRLRVKRVLRRNEELESLVSTRTRDLERANAAKSEFLAMMSHEIRNPMNGVVGLIRLLREELTSPKEQHTVRLLSGCAEQLRATVDDVLDFSKIEAGEIDLSSETFPIAGLIQEALAITGESGRFTVPHPPPDTVVIRADAAKIRQILVNFLTNALKYGAPPGGVVDVLLKDQHGHPQLTLSVRSLGPTIPKDVLDGLFEAFTRGEEAKRSNIRGTGLGLAICKRFAERMGGSVGAVSANAETTFYVTVPIEIVVGEALVEAPGPSDHGVAAGQPAKALAIEDEDYNRIVLGSILAKLNYTVDWATTGREALELAQANGYDIILTDYRLPDTNGADLTREILKLCPPPRPAVFAVTAYSTREKREECAAAGMSGFISKPITLEKLQAAIQSWGQNRLSRASIDQSARRALHPDVARAWEELTRNPSARGAHALNNLCRHHGLTDIAEQLELAEAALEERRDPAPFFRAAENLLIAAGVLAPS